MMKLILKKILEQVAEFGRWILDNQVDVLKAIGGFTILSFMIAWTLAIVCVLFGQAISSDFLRANIASVLLIAWIGFWIKILENKKKTK